MGIDLDKCRDSQSGVIDTWAQEIITELQSYTEISPSGQGLHLIAIGTLPADSRRKGRFEVYDQGRYFTVTGDHLPGTPLEIMSREVELLSIHRRVFALNQNFLPDSAGVEVPPCTVTNGTTFPHDEAQSTDPARKWGFNLNPNAEPPADKFAALLELDYLFRLSWQHARPDIYDQTASTYDQCLASRAFAAGWHEQEVVNLLLAHRRKYQADPEKSTRRRYFELTLDTAASGRSQESRQELIEGFESGISPF